MSPLSLIKGQVLYKEGDPLTHIYFVKSGELKISKKIVLPRNEEEAEEIMDNPNIILKS